MVFWFWHQALLPKPARYSTLRLAKLQPSAKLKTWDTRAMASKFSPKLPQLVEDLQRLADFLMHGTFGPKVPFFLVTCTLFQ